MRYVDQRPGSARVTANSRPESGAGSERLRLLVRNRFDRATRGGYSESPQKIDLSRLFLP